MHPNKNHVPILIQSVTVRIGKNQENKNSQPQTQTRILDKVLRLGYIRPFWGNHFCDSPILAYLNSKGYLDLRGCPFSEGS